LNAAVKPGFCRLSPPAGFATRYRQPHGAARGKDLLLAGIRVSREDSVYGIARLQTGHSQRTRELNLQIKILTGDARFGHRMLLLDAPLLRDCPT